MLLNASFLKVIMIFFPNNIYFNSQNLIHLVLCIDLLVMEVLLVFLWFLGFSFVRDSHCVTFLGAPFMYKGEKAMRKIPENNFQV